MRARVRFAAASCPSGSASRSGRVTCRPIRRRVGSGPCDAHAATNRGPGPVQRGYRPELRSSTAPRRSSAPARTLGANVAGTQALARRTSPPAPAPVPLGSRGFRRRNGSRTPRQTPASTAKQSPAVPGGAEPQFPLRLRNAGFGDRDPPSAAGPVRPVGGQSPELRRSSPSTWRQRLPPFRLDARAGPGASRSAQADQSVPANDPNAKAHGVARALVSDMVAYLPRPSAKKESGGNAEATAS